MNMRGTNRGHLFLYAPALLACAAIAACDGSQAPLPPKTPAVPAPTVAPPGDPRIRFVGRCDTGDPAIVRFAWPATGFAFRFTGGSLGLDLEDTALADGTPDDDWIAISLDGRELPPVALSQGRRTYEIARGLSAGTHEVAVTKRTEAEVGTVGLRGVVLDPGASLGPKPAAPARIVEIVGDSISAGFGVLGKSADCPFSAATEDATRTYGALAARDLGADVWITAWTGKGVLRNDDLADRDTLPILYERVLPGVPGSRYDFAVHPDAVVLNVGTNDFARNAPSLDAFSEAYAGFVEKLRALHPKALLVLALGPMLFDEGAIDFRTLARDAIEATIADRRRQGDANVETIEFWSNPADGAGCQVHPSAATHRKMASELVRLLEAKLGWKRR
jgi:lysophospholipase L1-like esterase